MTHYFCNGEVSRGTLTCGCAWRPGELIRYASTWRTSGTPVAGDPVYGNGKPPWLEGQCLHAKKIGFVHPRTGEYMEFDSELPEYFQKFLKSIEG